MWSKGILTRYADTLESEQGEALKREMNAIQYEDGRDVCVAIEGERAFARAGIAYLYQDLASRVIEFTTEDDMKALRNLSS